MDSIFFTASKLAWGLLSPSNLLALGLIVGVMLAVRGYHRLAKWFWLPSSVLVIALMVYPLGDLIMHPLETRFEQPKTLPEEIDGIILLGGGEQLKLSVSWGSAQLGTGGDRYLGVAILAKNYPEVPVIFTGGSGLLNLQGIGAGDLVAEQLLTAVGIQKDRIIIESNSRNTYENFVLVKPLLPKTNGVYLLVTSAFHMPRSVGIARQQGIDVIAYPVDYHSNKPYLRQWSMSLHEHLAALEIAWREWIGLTVYYFTGKTVAWFPEQQQ